MKSAPSDLRILSSKAETLQKKVALRSTMDLMFCPKVSANCTASDWTKEACTAPDCTIQGATVQYSTTKLGTYVLHGSGSYVVTGGDGDGKGKDGTSAASTISAALSLLVAALVYVFI